MPPQTPPAPEAAAGAYDQLPQTTRDIAALWRAEPVTTLPWKPVEDLAAAGLPNISGDGHTRPSWVSAEFEGKTIYAVAKPLAKDNYNDKGLRLTGNETPVMDKIVFDAAYDLGVPVAPAALWKNDAGQKFVLSLKPYDDTVTLQNYERANGEAAANRLLSSHLPEASSATAFNLFVGQNDDRATNLVFDAKNPAHPPVLIDYDLALDNANIDQGRPRIGGLADYFENFNRANTVRAMHAPAVEATAQKIAGVDPQRLAGIVDRIPDDFLGPEQKARVNGFFSYSSETFPNRLEQRFGGGLDDPRLPDIVTDRTRGDVPVELRRFLPVAAAPREDADFEGTLALRFKAQKAADAFKAGGVPPGQVGPETQNFINTMQELVERDPGTAVLFARNLLNKNIPALEQPLEWAYQRGFESLTAGDRGNAIYHASEALRSDNANPAVAAIASRFFDKPELYPAAAARVVAPMPPLPAPALPAAEAPPVKVPAAAGPSTVPAPVLAEPPPPAAPSSPVSHASAPPAPPADTVHADPVHYGSTRPLSPQEIAAIDRPPAVSAPETSVIETVVPKTATPSPLAPGGKIASGVASIGIVTSLAGLHQAYETGDRVEGTISGVNLATSTVSAAAPVLSEVAPVLKTATKFVPGLNIATTVADGAWQVSKEDTVQHKEERAVAAGATAAVGLGLGAATATMTGTGVVASVVGTTAAPLVVAAAPVVLTGAAVYETARVGEAVVENKRAWDALDQQIDEYGRPSRRDVSVPGAGGKPSLIQFGHIAGALSEVSPDMKDSSLSAPLERDARGRITVDQIRGFDLSDPKNLAEFERALDAKIAKDQAVAKDNASAMPRWLRFSDSLLREEDARADLAPLQAARTELDMYKQDLAQYAAAPPSKFAVSAPAKSGPDVASLTGSTPVSVAPPPKPRSQAPGA